MVNTTKLDIRNLVKENGYADTQTAVSQIHAGSSATFLDTAISDNFYGINHRQEPGAVPINKDGYGLTLWTRPMMNMASDNIRQNRLFIPLLNKDPNSMQRILRAYLDPRLAREGTPAPLADPQMAFIPILTNNLIGISGWPDVEVDTFTSSPGVYKEAWFMADSVSQNLSTYDITANFRNIDGDPITALFFYWIHYMSLVYLGDFIPYPEYIIENRIDYMTRIYRLVLDKDKRYVQKIGATGIAAPLSTPIGAAFNYDSSTPLNKSNDQLSITFRCAGAIYQDVILIWTFNQTQAAFNSEMADNKFTAKLIDKSRDPNNRDVWKFSHPTYKQIPYEALGVFNSRGYPRIAPENNELQWWVPPDLYQERYGIYLKQNGV